MCGILVWTQEYAALPELPALRAAVARRGPDHYGTEKRGSVTFESSVLQLRDEFMRQPSVRGNSVLCFNGQIYAAGAENDTEYVHDLCADGRFAELMATEGEFAFVYFDGEDKIFFGRDTSGRRSLGFTFNVDNYRSLLISSVGLETPGYAECECEGALYEYFVSAEELHCNSLPYKFEVSRTVDDDRSGDENSDRARALQHALTGAVESRISTIPATEQGVAVLFSGGLDCTLLAALLDDLLPSAYSINLLNVAFENKRTGSQFDTPDRLLARRSLAELQQRSSNEHEHEHEHDAQWQRLRLVEINVPYDEAVAHRAAVRSLMAPSSTVMDLSIAIAFYFASRPQPDCLNPRVLFSGLGADELFAGYSRHTRLAQDAELLAAELEKDFLRLPHRNFGRDDRVCANWGREVRYPFLDSAVVSQAQTLPLNCKTDGTTTKIILRAVASNLGLGDVVHEKKRAIQFGARSAKMDPGSGKSKGHQGLN